MTDIPSRVVSIQDGIFVCTDGAGFFTRPATDDEKLFWAEVVRLRTEHEEDLSRMERATEVIGTLTERVNELQALGQAASIRADDAERRAIETNGDREERWKRVVSALSQWESTPRMSALVTLDAIRMAVLEPLDRPAVKTPVAQSECICPTCGLRHGGSNIAGGF